MVIFVCICLSLLPDFTYLESLEILVPEYCTIISASSLIKTFKVPQRMIPLKAQYYALLMFHHRKLKLHLIDTKGSLDLHIETFIMTL